MTATWGYILTAVFLGGLLIVISRYFMLWLQAYVTGTRIGLLSLVLMSLRKVSPTVIVQCKVMAVQAGLPDVTTDEMEAQYLAGGDVVRVTLALIAAHRARLDLDWNTAAAIDLAGRDILEAVRLSVSPQVINCPDPDAGHGDTLDAVARDGIQLKARVRVTVRTNVSQLIGGATEATVIARVGEAIVSAIGSCDSYKDAIADPFVITRQVIRNGLDAQTAFAIVSIDIADITVGANIGARLQTDQAEADIRIARANAETKRAMAVARQQKMIALTTENRAAVVLAEAQIPAALAGAYRAGQLHAQRSPARRLGPSGTNARAIGRTGPVALAGATMQTARNVEAWETDGGSCGRMDVRTDPEHGSPI